MSTPAPAPRSRARIAAAGAAIAFAALVVGAALGIAYARRTASSTQLAPSFPIDPLAYVPGGARGLFYANVDRLTASPALHALLAAMPADTGSCDARLIRRVRRVAAAWGGGAASEIGVAFVGDLPRADLLACARRRATNADVRSTRLGEIQLVQLVPHGDDAVVTGDEPTAIVYVDRGPVLAGSAEMVTRMLERGRAGALLPDQDMPLARLRARLGSDYDAVGAVLFDANGLADVDPALRGVSGIAIGARFDTDAHIAAVIACRDFDAPRTVADALVRMRTNVGALLGVPALSSLLDGVTIERRAADVRVEGTIPGALLRALLDAASANPPAGAAPTAP